MFAERQDWNRICKSRRQLFFYQNAGIAAMMRTKRRLFENRSFPHEIGLFLGYPLDDVIGFIRNEGRNCKYTGFWKVYCNEEEAARIFEKFRKCRDVYMRLWQQGKSVLQLTVAA